MKNENLWGLNKPIQPSEIHSTLFKQRSDVWENNVGAKKIKIIDSNIINYLILGDTL